MDNSKLICAARDILSCAGIPFHLIMSDGRALKVLNHGSTAFCESVTFRFDSKATGSMCVSFNVAPQPEENTAILSGTIATWLPGSSYFDVKFDNGTIRFIPISPKVAEYLSKNAKTGDKIKFRAHFDSDDILNSPDDILSHTREENVTINLKE